MVTYVNTVLVSNDGTIATSVESAKKGQFILFDIDNNKYTLDATTQRFKIGMATGKKIKDFKGNEHNEIRWSNVIQTADIKNLSTLNYPGDDAENTEDKIEINFSDVDASVMNLLAAGGKRIIVRLTFKDLPTRFRKWTESYEYVTALGDTAETIATGIATLINKQWKRARVNAKAEGGVVTLEAMPYDDDDAIETLNWAEKVRFNANVYFTDPAAEGWESLNKHFPKGLKITKTPGFRYAANAKLVRDREAQAMGYMGILNRGEGTWPVIKPAMETQLDGKYNALTLEFENMYRAADDIFRKNKQTVEIYSQVAADITSIASQIKAAMGKNDRVTTSKDIEEHI